MYTHALFKGALCSTCTTAVCIGSEYSTYVYLRTMASTFIVEPTVVDFGAVRPHLCSGRIRMGDRMRLFNSTVGITVMLVLSAVFPQRFKARL